MWWSLRPLSPVQAPPGLHPVDHFLGEQRQVRGLSTGPLAEKAVLARRLYLDLTGIVPTPRELDLFVRDTRPDAYERLVDQLLASPRYGERMARHWLDVARYAETHGHDQDRVRPHAWRYRDWVIQAFNNDLGYGDFARAQIAADAFAQFGGRDIPALGFLAAGPWDESSLRDIREDSIDREQGRYLDRDDMVSAVGSAFLGLTVQCARCHDHKFDPISQEEYYSLQAVFAGVDKANRPFDEDPGLDKKRTSLAQSIATLQANDARTLALLEQPDLATKAVQLLKEWKQSPNLWVPISGVQISTDGPTLWSPLGDGSFLASGSRPDKEILTLEFSHPSAWGAIRLEALTHASLPHQGPGRQDNGNLHINEIELWALKEKGPPRRIGLSHPRADWNQEGWTATHTLDENPATAWGIYPRVGKSHQLALSLTESIQTTPMTRYRLVIKQIHGGGHLLGRIRLSVASLPHQALPADADPEWAALASKPDSQKTKADHTELARLVLLKHFRDQVATLPPPQLVYAAASRFEPDGSHKPAPSPRLVRVLKRGDIRKPAEVAFPGALACLPHGNGKWERPHGAGDEESWRRETLARWVTHPDNPLFWRVMANRVWLWHFGNGIVDTPNDLGKMGGKPTHPGLLDHLALKLRDSGGSIKSLHRLIVTSHAYRQVWREDSQARATDSENRFLWRWRRPRLDAEQFRDSLLAASGRLEERGGGPSDQPFTMKPGVHVTPVVNHEAFDWSRGNHRRSVYSLVFRTIPDPFVECLDGADPTASVPKRGESHSPLQALTIWNGDFTLTMAVALAESVSREVPDPSRRVDQVCLRLWGRLPQGQERSLLEETEKRQGLVAVCRLAIGAHAFAFVE